MKDHSESQCSAQPTNNKIRRIYNKLAPVYDFIAERSEGPIRERAIKHLNLKLGGKVLEIGFGTGQALMAFARAVGEEGVVVGIDISEQMLAVANRRLRKHGLADRVKLLHGDARSLPFSAEQFDVVFLSFTLELFKEPERDALLAEIRRVLSPKGRLAIVSLNKPITANFAVSTYKLLQFTFPNLLACTPIPLDKILETAGFEIIICEDFRMWGLSTGIRIARLGERQ